MGLARNLKKILKSTAKEVLKELSSLYTELKEESTSRKPDNSSSTESLPNPLTTDNPPTTIATSSAGTSEKITMDKIVMDPTEDVVIWAIDRINDLIDQDTEDSRNQAMSMIKEYEEWIESVQNDQEVNYTVIKSKDNQGWTQEQEIDIQDTWG